MSAFDYVTFMQYHNWANEQLVATAEKMPLDQLMGGQRLSQGTAFETLRHMLDVDWSWRLACNNEPATNVLWELVPLEDLAALKAYWRGEADLLVNFVRGLSDEDLEREIVPSWGKQPFKVKHVITHIVDHGANHRSELGWYFTKVCCSPGDIGFMDYLNSLRS